jgi:hypothetical protein
LKRTSGKPRLPEGASTRAAHLRDAIVQRARENTHSAADLARALEMSVGHWYRVRAQPERLGRLPRPRLDAICRYVGWTPLQVMLAVGWLLPTDVEAILSPQDAIDRALQRLTHGGLANGLRTPVARASREHQVLMGRLLIAAEGTATEALGASP